MDPFFSAVGLDHCLALSTIKGQIPACAISFQRQLASHSVIKAFVQKISHVVLPGPIPSTFVEFDFGASEAPFELFRDIPLSALTKKKVFSLLLSPLLEDWLNQ